VAALSSFPRASGRRQQRAACRVFGHLRHYARPHWREFAAQNQLEAGLTIQVDNRYSTGPPWHKGEHVLIVTGKGLRQRAVSYAYQHGLA
jgi:hypothetical protein